ncbi:MAG: hypothetical protein IPM91_08885 [Bacteroidetes bacterium]|nr:hypothetical protein [Bacteroidota bacterium]
MQSEYHNLPVINGKPQVFGAQYKASDTRFNAEKISSALILRLPIPKKQG